MKDAMLGPGGSLIDAQQGAALVHLHRERRMPDVRNIRSGYDIVWIKPDK